MDNKEICQTMGIYNAVFTIIDRFSALRVFLKAGMFLIVLTYLANPRSKLEYPKEAK